MSEYEQIISRVLDAANIAIVDIDQRDFPDERWFVVRVAEEALAAALSLAGAVEQELNRSGLAATASNQSLVVTFRPHRAAETTPNAVKPERKGLSAPRVDQLVQLLEARSRTSDALPSLKYVEDPRASISAIGASRHHLVYGRRGVGKTALLLEAKRQAEKEGHVVGWINAQVVRYMDVASAFLAISQVALKSLLHHAGTSQGDSILLLRDLDERVSDLRAQPAVSEQILGQTIAELNQALRGVLRAELIRLYLYIDDFYLYPINVQPRLLDCVTAMLRDCNGWLKVASIERLTRPFEPSSKMGVEIPHDASKIDLDLTLEDPEAADLFLHSVLSNYTTTVGINKPSSIARTTALGRLVLASGGVPRDYLNLFASSIIAARRDRPNAREIGKEDVAEAAGKAARDKKRDLHLDVSSDNAEVLLAALETISTKIRGEKYTYFRVDLSQKSHSLYQILGQLVDLRFAHLILAGLSDKHRPGVKYEAYILDLSEYSGVRLKRGLSMLDLENGKWKFLQSGTAGTEKSLTGTALRDKLRLAPILDLEALGSEIGHR